MNNSLLTIIVFCECLCVCVAMENNDQNTDELLPALSVIKSIFDDFGLTDLDDNIYIHVMDIISS